MTLADYVMKNQFLDAKGNIVRLYNSSNIIVYFLLSFSEFITHIFLAYKQLNFDYIKFSR